MKAEKTNKPTRREIDNIRNWLKLARWVAVFGIIGAGLSLGVSVFWCGILAAGGSCVFVVLDALYLYVHGLAKCASCHKWGVPARLTPRGRALCESCSGRVFEMRIGSGRGTR